MKADSKKHLFKHASCYNTTTRPYVLLQIQLYMWKKMQRKIV